MGQVTAIRLAAGLNELLMAVPDREQLLAQIIFSRRNETQGSNCEANN
jgi:hypothetical protein